MAYNSLALVENRPSPFGGEEIPRYRKSANTIFASSTIQFDHEQGIRQYRFSRANAAWTKRTICAFGLRQKRIKTGFTVVQWRRSEKGLFASFRSGWRASSEIHAICVIAFGFGYRCTARDTSSVDSTLKPKTSSGLRNFRG